MWDWSYFSCPWRREGGRAVGKFTSGTPCLRTELEPRPSRGKAPGKAGRPCPPLPQQGTAADRGPHPPPGSLLWGRLSGELLCLRADGETQTSPGTRRWEAKGKSSLLSFCMDVRVSGAGSLWERHRGPGRTWHSRRGHWHQLFLPGRRVESLSGHWVFSCPDLLLSFQPCFLLNHLAGLCLPLGLGHF